MLDWFIWFFQSLVMAFYNIGYAITHPALWLDWTEGKAVMRFIYYGASQELF
ncbi:MAG TPA: C4-dicarboxylate ABC transporter permease, partial [Planktomarina temperata]|nr:C4-dicarboxylate ABC transporter permease [Planktomarina temperata]